MSNRWARLLLILNCLALGTVGVSARAVAADSSTNWPNKKKKKKHHKHHKASSSTSTSTKTGAAPAEEADEGGDEGGDDEADETEKDQPVKSKPAKKEKADRDNKDDKADKDDEREASDEKGEGDEGSGEDVVIHRKARHVADASGPAPVAFELSVGPRLVHRSFDFNDPLSNHVAGAMKPYSYVLPAGPSPFIDLGFYPAAIGSAGPLANIGLVGSYEKLVATKTQSGTSNTVAQQFEIGLRGRLPLGANEVGLAATYGQQTFHVNDTDPGPGAGGTVPNVDYTFVGLDADGRLRLDPITLAAHVGTRFVTHTGDLGKMWFPTVKTTVIEAGVSAAYRLTPLFEVVAGADLLRYAFDFNPVPQQLAFIAGGAVDQYISGYLALRVTFSGG
ncbi:MAG TPA: hypothetical protein VK989_07285 [Polyangia bacterium]|jgi:hypothetical protein|nr:hypothetical protein [Polyangia bacterium]